MAGETTLFSQVFTAATKPLDKTYMKHCPLDKELCARAAAVVQECIEETFIPKMEERDDLFGNLYSKIQDAGSYYDGLRIVEPTEFDLDVILEIPFPEQIMKLDFGDGFPIPCGFACYYCSSPPKDVKTTKELTKDQERLFLTFFEENVLLPVRVRKWFRKVVDKAFSYFEHHKLYHLQNEVTIQKFNWRKHSPAATIRVKVDHELEIDIDLVPVFSHGRRC